MDYRRTPRKNILFKLTRDAERMEGDPREITVSPVPDPYQSDEAARLTRKALLIMEQHRLRVQIATLCGMRSVRDFDILARNRWKYATMMLFQSESLREEWEPGGHRSPSESGHSTKPMQRESRPGFKSIPRLIRPS